jgi:hypothetical protein
MQKRILIALLSGTFLLAGCSSSTAQPPNTSRIDRPTQPTDPQTTTSTTSGVTIRLNRFTATFHQGYTASFAFGQLSPEPLAPISIAGDHLDPTSACGGQNMLHQPDAMVPFELTIENTSSAFEQTLSVDLLEEAGVVEQSALVSDLSSASCQPGLSGTTGFQWSQVPSEHTDTVVGLFLLSNYYSPSYPNGDTSVSLQARIMPADGSPSENPPVSVNLPSGSPLTTSSSAGDVYVYDPVVVSS